ncbi:hypothetical protein U9M48_031218 [Paspalum notatum var. saurae]|uniref:Protein FAR1-RELATED SEQUENCE n=1 Tax=Paspalum notatum var. saurae TaxID=547442 RepID=A0AAQ3U4M1_PASNO
MAAMGGGHGPSLSWALAVVGDGGSEGHETEADPLEVQTSEPGNGAGMVFPEHAAVAEWAQGAILGGGPAENCRQSSDSYENIDDAMEDILELYSGPSVIEPKIGQLFKEEGKDRSAGENPTRIGCKAMIRINRPSEQHEWRVTAFELSHNHGVKRDASHTINYRSHNHIDDFTKSMHGGPAFAPFTRKALNRLVYTIRKDECYDDVQKTLDFFREIQLHSRNFYYAVQVDSSSRINNIFWAHASSRLSFEHFGDVVTFDTTYKTNRYNMPFGFFVGVNNHFQSVVFGCALLREETVESFEWLFSTFSQAMQEKETVSILTDNCHQMEVAISEVWPHAKHRVCKWHVLKKAKENLGNIDSRKRSAFKDEFHEAINLPNTPDEFERAWKDVRRKYEPEKSTYLDRMWDMREKWAPAYFKDFFFAKISITQRKICDPSSSLNGFARRYEDFYHDRLQAESAEEFHCFNGKVTTTTSSPIERHAAHATQKENELRVVYNGDNTKKFWGREVYEVQANFADKELSCACKLFEHLGILSSHILMVLVHYGFKEIPEKYIMKRWTKGARDWSPDRLQGYTTDRDAMESQVYRQCLLRKHTVDFIKMGDATSELFQMAMEGLLELMDKMKLKATRTDSSVNDTRKSERVSERKTVTVEMGDTDGGGAWESEDEVSDGMSGEDDDILESYSQPPEMRRGRGRPKVSRYLSKAESASVGKKEEKKKAGMGSAEGLEATRKMQIRYCSKCGNTGHNRSTCGRESSYKRNKSGSGGGIFAYLPPGGGIRK